MNVSPGDLRKRAALLRQAETEMQMPGRVLHGLPAMLDDAADEIEASRVASQSIRDLTGQRQDRPWSTLSQIDQIARKALAP